MRAGEPYRMMVLSPELWEKIDFPTGSYNLITEMIQVVHLPAF